MAASSPSRAAPVVRDVRAAVHAALADRGATLLAVSGGVDSMVLLDAALAGAPERVAAVATFDHGTGDASRAAAAHVAAEGARRGVRVLSGAASLAGAGEAAWREARWRFLRDAAREAGADGVATAHTRDDQVETVAMRVLRDAGARGLAGLLAPAAGVIRPLLDVRRREIEAYAAARRLRWVEDPGNASWRHLRNRVRLDLLPALRAADPSIDEALVAIGRRAAAWRRDVDAFVDRWVRPRVGEGGAIHVATGEIAWYDAEELAVLWPAIAARAGVRLDRRGTVRLVAFTTRVAAGAAANGAEIQLSGAVEVEAGRGEIVIRLRRSRSAAAAGSDYAAEVPVAGDVTFAGWRLRRGTSADLRWSACLPTDRPLTVRAWRAGDRMRGSAGQAARRVKRYFADARIPGRERTGWPVVLAGEDIVWIPGVRRSDAATDRPGRPGVHFVCERIDG